jgi:hypothetical protein
MDFGTDKSLSTSIAYSKLARKMAPQIKLETKLDWRFMIESSRKK